MSSRKKMRDRVRKILPLKTYKDIYKFPLEQWKDFSRVSDKVGNFVFEFITRFDDKGDYQEGWTNYEKEVLSVINGEKTFLEDNLTYSHKEGYIFVSNLDKPIILIRGWGNLTGVGGHNLSGEEAANIQDTFSEFIISQLNKKNKL